MHHEHPAVVQLTVNDQDAHILYTHDSAVKKELKNAAQAHTRTRLTEWL